MLTTNSATSSFATGVLPELSPGIASLDSPQVQQTKAEIRSLVAEIAELSNLRIEPSEFYRGMLPRVCSAMGATGACVWRTVPGPNFISIAQHTFPQTLLDSDSKPTDPHRRILDCIYTEGQPVLVPPGSVSLEVARPSNPLDEALLIVPVRIDDQVDFLLEVVQRPGGGPVAQRGYLRFVAQMADLMADFLRRDSLRKLSENEQHVARFHQAFIAVANCKTQRLRFSTLATAIDELLGTRQTILLTGASRFRVVAIGGIESPDPRSEVVLLARKTASAIKKMRHTLDSAIDGDTATKSQPLGRSNLLEIYPNRNDTILAWGEPQQDSARLLCELLAADELVALVLNRDRSVLALLPTDDSQVTEQFRSRADEIATAFEPLTERPDSFLSRFVASNRSIASKSHSTTVHRRLALAQRWILRLSIVGLAIAVAVFPVPQQVSVTGILEPTEKLVYYAPTSALVDAIHIDQNVAVVRGQLLVELVDQQLIAELDLLLGQQSETRSQLAQIQSTLARNAQLPALQRDQLESQREQLAVSAATTDAQLKIMQSQLSSLKIVARDAGTVASWELRNRLASRPVQAGQALLTTYKPEGPWQLQLSIPEHRIGLVSQAIESNPSGARIRFSLSSHPGKTREGRIKNLGSQAVRDAEGQSTVQATAAVESSALPIKKDGAVARATIDCGQVPAIWLVTRDAVWAISSRLRMVW